MKAAWLALLFVIPVALPLVAAAEVQLSTPPAQLVPNEPWNGTLTVTLPCTEVAGAESVTWDVDDGGAGFSISGSKSRAVDATRCASPSGTLTEEFAVTIHGGMLIPAEESHEVTFTAGAGDNQASTTVELAMQYVGTFSMQVPTKLLQAGPQKQIAYDIQLVSESNARTVIKWEMVDAPDGKWQGVLPDHVILGPVGSADATQTTQFIVATPFNNGNNNEEGGFTIKATSFSALQDTEGESAEANMVSRVRGFYVPGPGFLLVPLLLGAAALRRK